MPRAAITGASGHLGANMLRVLLERDYAVHALCRADQRACEGLSVERISGDVLDPAALRVAFTGVDVVFHLAAIVTLGEDKSGLVWRTNVEGTRNVVDACIACGVKRLVHFSSIHAFSAHPADEPVTELRALATEPNLPLYDRTKVAAEAEALKGIERGLEVVIVNPTAVVGPFDYKPSPMGRVLLDLRARRLPAVIKGGFNWVDARDVCIGAECAARNGVSGEKYLLAGNYATLGDLAQLASTVTGSPPPRFVTPVWMAQLALPFAAMTSAITGKEVKFTSASLRAVTHHQQVSHAKAAEKLSYTPRPLVETLTDTYTWFQTNGYA